MTRYRPPEGPNSRYGMQAGNPGAQARCAGRQGRKREAAAELGGSAAAYHVDRLRAGLTPPFFSSAPPGAESHTRLWFAGPQSVIPRPDGHPTWFVVVSAAIRIGSRTDPSHCTPRRQIGVGVARDWPHLSEPGRSPGSRTT